MTRAAARSRTAGCPTSTRSTRGTRSRSSGSATRTTRPARSRRSRSTRSSPRVRASTGSSLCSDEAYSELWFDEPPVSALQVADRTNVVVFNTLSKRSSMTGYRSGFVCAPAEIVDGAAQLPPDRRHGAAGVRAARVRRRVVGRRRTSTTCARSTAASARPSSRRSSRRACGSPARRRRSTSGSRSAARRRSSRGGCSSTAIVVAPGSFFGAGRRGLRPLRARADAGGVRARGRRSCGQVL